jgi:hypothetical protein
MLQASRVIEEDNNSSSANNKNNQPAMYNNETSYIINDYEHVHQYHAAVFHPEANYVDLCAQAHLPQFQGYVMHNVFGQPVYHHMQHPTPAVQEVPSTPLDLQLVFDEEHSDHMEVAVPRAQHYVEVKHEPMVVAVSKEEPNPFDYIKKEEDKNSNTPTRSLPKQSTMILKAWLYENATNPYPSDEVKNDLAIKTRLDLCKINNWFINARRRLLKRMIEQKKRKCDDNDVGSTYFLKKMRRKNSNTVCLHCQKAGMSIEKYKDGLSQSQSRKEKINLRSRRSSDTRQEEPLLICNKCCNAMHPTCVNISCETIKNIDPHYWRCAECKLCEICNSSNNDQQTLICDGCDRAFHCFCLENPLQNLPEGQWYCGGCTDVHSNSAVESPDSSVHSTM